MSNLRHFFATKRPLLSYFLHGRCVARCVQRHASSTQDEDAPIRYSTSRANKWSARQSRAGRGTDIPWFQPYAITLSLATFLLYFCALREENDIDLELGRTLYDRIDGLEKKQLEISLQYSLDNNLNTSDIKNRLAEIEQEAK